MSSPDPLAVLEVAERNELESLLMEFDGNWRANSLDEYGRRVAFNPDQQYRRVAMAELVKVDLHRNWSGGNGRLLEEYLDQFPTLGNAESVTADLILAEYEARSTVDPELALASYESRFPKRFQQVKQLAGELFESSMADSSSPKRTEKELAQASIDTSRVDQLRDTKDGKKRDTVVELPVEFGRYRILKELGSGAMGKVYLAHDSQLDRQVALKTPSFSGSNDDDMVTRFYREARSAAKIQHRNICPIFDVGEIDGRHFISMAFVKGRCMSDFIKPGKMPPQRTSAILVQRLAVALAEAHRHNVIHRDLKPTNIMIDLKKEPIVMDFGLARQMDVESRVTQSGMAVGTPAYMSPEQIRGELEEVGTTADIYALGVILYELLTGQLPFRGPIAKVVYAIVHDVPAAPSTISHEIEPELEAICAKMMAKNRDERYQSMDDVAAKLKRYLKGVGKKPSATSSASKSRAETISSTAQLTETGALNAFFAAQADADSRGTLVEPAVNSQPAVMPTLRSASGRSDRNGRGRNPWIALGSCGGAALLLGVIIYFNGGKVELDSDSDAVVNVDHQGNVKIRPGSDTKQGVAAKEPKQANPQVAPSAPNQLDRSLSNPNVELLNEWQHFDADLSNCYFARLSPNGLRVAFRMGDGPLKIAETDSKQAVEIPDEMEDAISIAFSDDDRLIATGHDDKKVRVWNADSLAPVGEPFELPIEQNVPWVHLSADGTKLIALGNDHDKLRHASTFSTWEISTRKLISRFQVDMDSQRKSDSIDASADGSRVAVISLHNGPTLCDTTTGEKVPVQFEFDEKLADMRRMTGMDLSADASRLVYGTLWGAPSYSAILDTSTGQERWNSGKCGGRVHCVQFTRDGKWLASTAGHTNAHQISLWDVNSGAEVKRWTYPYDSENENATAVKFLSFSRDGSKLLLTGPHMPIVVWRLFDKDANDLPSQKEAQLSSTEHTKTVTPTVGASPDDRDIAEKIVGFGGSVQLVGSDKWIWTMPEGDIRVVGVSFFRKQKHFGDEHIALLGQLPNLQAVLFYPNDMTSEGIATLAEMENVVENVEVLRFNRVALGPKALAALAKLKRLEILTLHHTDLIDDDLKLLANLPALKELILQQHSKKKFGPAFLTDDCLKHLKTVSGLRKLTLIGQQFTDACLVNVEDLQLEELWLATPNVTDSAVARLREHRPRLGVTRFKESPEE